MKKRIFVIGGITIGLALIVFVLLFFQPQRLLYDNVVEEERPDVVLPPPTTNIERTEPSGETPVDPLGPPPEVLSSDDGGVPSGNIVGNFRSLNGYSSSGTAEVLNTADGQRILRFEDFETDNAPDLFVYLTDKSPGEDFTLNDNYIDLGRLKGNIGSQNYEIPQDADLGGFSTVLIYCKRLTVTTGIANLSQN